MKKLAVLLALAVCAGPAFAGDTGVLKLSLWGKRLALAVPANTQEITGIDFGIGSDAASVSGVQLDLVYAKSDTVKGVQFGLYNQADELHGLQLGFVNNVKNINGLQIGLVNIAKNGWFPVMVIVNGRF